jgi:hypothetical protein
MGGLIARWYVEMCGGAEITRKLITLGTPYRGAPLALGQLVNGPNPRLGRLPLELTRFARSMPSLHQLLPEYACLEQGDGLATITSITLPELNTAMVTDAMRFHTDLQGAEARRPESLTSTYAIVGTDQHTATTARLTGRYIELINSYLGEDLYGDSTVPIIAACRPDIATDGSTLYSVPDKHGNLQENTAVLDKIEGILTTRTIKAAKSVGLRVDVPELALPGEDITVQVTPTEPSRHNIHLWVRSEVGTLVSASVLRPANGTLSTTVSGLAPGAYIVDVTGSSSFASVSSNILIWEPRYGVEDWDRPLSRNAHAGIAASR